MSIVILTLAGLTVLAPAIALVLIRRSDSDTSVESSTEAVDAGRPSTPSTPPSDHTPAHASGPTLQPYSPIPLTLTHATPQALSALRKVLEDENSYGRAQHDRVLELLLTSNARVLEIDEFIARCSSQYRAAVQKLCESDPEWASAGELDRRDILEGARRKAISHVDVRISGLDYAAISEPPALPASADDELLARYGFELLSFYMRHAEDLSLVHSIPADDYYRPRFEALVSKGLAKRGADVDAEGILRTLTLKQMEGLVEDIEHKRFTRRATAIEFLLGVQGLRERLGRHVSMRELFQLTPLPEQFSHLDLPAVAHAWAFADQYATLLEITYSTAKYAHREVADASSYGHSPGWRIDMPYGDEPCCSTCAEQVGKRLSARNVPRLPHHVGCRCQLSTA